MNLQEEVEKAIQAAAHGPGFVMKDCPCQACKDAREAPALRAEVEKLKQKLEQAEARAARLEEARTAWADYKAAEELDSEDALEAAYICPWCENAKTEARAARLMEEAIKDAVERGLAVCCPRCERLFKCILGALAAPPAETKGAFHV